MDTTLPSYYTGLDFYAQVAQLEEGRRNPGDSALDALTKPVLADPKFAIDIDTPPVPRDLDTKGKKINIGMIILYVLASLFLLIALVVLVFPENEQTKAIEDVEPVEVFDPHDTPQFRAYQERKRAALHLGPSGYV